MPLALIHERGDHANRAKDEQDGRPPLDHLGNMMGALLEVPKRDVQKTKADED